MWFRAVTSDDGPALRSVFHLASHVFVDLEGVDPDVGADRDNELGGVVRKSIDDARHDSGDCTPPASVRRADVPCGRMRDQHRHAIACACSDSKTFGTRDQRIAFFIGYGL